MAGMNYQKLRERIPSRVALGAALLDELCPGRAARASGAEQIPGDGFLCRATEHGSHPEAIAHLGLTGRGVAHGFGFEAGSTESQEDPLLSEAWRTEIEKRA